MTGRVLVVLRGAWELNQPQRKSLVSWIEYGLKGVVSKAGKTLAVRFAALDSITKPDSDTVVFGIDFVTEKRPEKEKRCQPGNVTLGDCGTGSVFITAHRELAVCGPNQASRYDRVLTTDEWLGHALANTSLHELGHLIGGFEDNMDAGDLMSTLGLPKQLRTKRNRREFFAGTMNWKPHQEQELIKNLKSGQRGFEIQTH